MLKCFMIHMFCITLPDIWSPFHEFDPNTQTTGNTMKPYQFRWIE